MQRVSKHIDLERDGLAIEAEYLQTDQWAIDAILRHEILTPVVVDPCSGDGRMAIGAWKAGAIQVYAGDKYDWGFTSSIKQIRAYHGIDFIGEMDTPVHDAVEGATVFMNSPFSIACEFVDQAMSMGARKIVAFQRSVWRESENRREWWARNPPNRIYQCGNRADCWYGTIPLENRKGGANQPHSFYVWEKGHPPGTLSGIIYKTGKVKWN